MTKSTKLSLAVLGVAVLMAAASYIGRDAGARAAEEGKERLLLVWPSLMDMPLSDRAFVVGLAMTCNLETRAVAKDEVIACLRAAAVDPESTLPNGFDRAGAPAKLEAMLRERSNPAAK